MNQASLRFLAARLERQEHAECSQAALLVRQALESPTTFDRADAEQALCHAVWGHLDNALEGAAGQRALELMCMRAEMAGYVYTARLALGWIERSKAGPKQPPSLADFGF